MLRHISILVGVFGFIFLLGTAGSADIQLLENGAIVGRLLLSFLLLGLGFFGVRYSQIKAVQERYRWMRRYERSRF